MRLIVSLFAAALLLGGAAISPMLVRAQTQAEAEPEEPTVFPDGENRDEIFYICTACHSSAIVRAQGHSRERWAEVLASMTEKHGMIAPEGEEREVMLNYLAKAFPPRGRVYTNPFLKQ